MKKYYLIAHYSIGYCGYLLERNSKKKIFDSEKEILKAAKKFRFKWYANFYCRICNAVDNVGIYSVKEFNREDLA